MEWISKLLSVGPTVILAAAVLVGAVALYEFSKRWYRRSENGERRKLPFVIECPNKQAMIEIMKQSRLQQTSNTETLRLVERVVVGIEHLEGKHEEYTGDGVAAALGGVASIKVGVDRLLEEVKPGSRSQKVSEESRDWLIKMGIGQESMMELLEKILTAVKNGNGRRT
jgi:hypothetical protein